MLGSLPGLLRRGRTDARGLSATIRSASTPEAAPSRRILGSAPVKSSTVDGVPGSGRASSSAAAAERSSAGTSSSVRGSASPDRFALVAASAPTCSNSSRATPPSSGIRIPIVLRLATRRASRSVRPDSARRACTAPAGAHRRSWPNGPAAPGCARRAARDRRRRARWAGTRRAASGGRALAPRRPTPGLRRGRRPCL